MRQMQTGDVSTGTPGPIVTCASMYSSGGTQRSDFSLLPSYKHSRAPKHVKSLAVELIVLQTFTCFFASISVWNLKIVKKKRKKGKDNFYLLRMFTYKFLQLPGKEFFFWLSYLKRTCGCQTETETEIWHVCQQYASQGETEQIWNGFSAPVLDV